MLHAPIRWAGFCRTYNYLLCVVMLAYQRSPLLLRKLRHKKVLQVISAISLTTTFGVEVANLQSCHAEFGGKIARMVIWEIAFSICLSCLELHAAQWVGKKSKGEFEDGVTTAAHADSKMHGRNQDIEKGDICEGHVAERTPSEKMATSDCESENTMVNVENMTATQEEKKTNVTNGPADILWWIVAYCSCTVIVISGLISMVVDEIVTKHAVERMTMVFGTFSGTVWGFCLLAILWNIFENQSKNSWDLFWIIVFEIALSLITIGVVGPLYGDWVLGAISGNLGGVPKLKNAALYCIFFTARLLHIFSL